MVSSAGSECKYVSECNKSIQFLWCLMVLLGHDTLKDSHPAPFEERKNKIVKKEDLNMKPMLTNERN